MRKRPLRKVVDVAMREYKSTALTKAFFFGVFVFPVLVIGIITVVVPLFDSPPKRLQGVVAVQDTTGADQAIASALEAHFAPDRIAENHEKKKAKIEEELRAKMPKGMPQTEAMIAKVRKALGEPPDVRIERLPEGLDLAAEKDRIRNQPPLGRKASDPNRRLAIVIAGPEALDTGGGFELFVGRGMDADLARDLRDVVSTGIVDTRLARAGLDAQRVRALSARPDGKTTTLTATGEAKNNEALQMLLPFSFMILLWIAVFSSGQYLLTTTIEEKSSRVIELLLSAVSPMQLMAGKIIGQAFVGMTILAVYGGVALLTAKQFNVLSLVPTEQLPWILVYFVIAYFLIGSMMAAIGSAVNEMREAQSFMSVAMLVLMVPFFLWNLIIKQPNSTFSTVTSFIPPISPFVMVMRLGQTTEPIPLWQIIGSSAVGLVSVVIAVWAAAKIFRVGVLMYGKPPTPLTLLRWLRYA